MWRRGSEDPGADIPVAVWMVVPMGRFRARRRTPCRRCGHEVQIEPSCWWRWPRMRTQRWTRRLSGSPTASSHGRSSPSSSAAKSRMTCLRKNAVSPACLAWPRWSSSSLGTRRIIASPWCLIDCAISCCSFVSLRLGANTRNHQRMERKKNPIERLLKKSNRKAVTNCNEISSLFRLIR